MASQNWIQCVQSLHAAGPTQTTGGPTSLLASGDAYSFKANDFFYPGQQFRAKGGGIITTTSTPTSLTIALYFGAVIVATTGSIALVTSVVTSAIWDFEFLCTIRSIGGGTGTTNIYLGHIAGQCFSVFYQPIPTGVSSPSFTSAGWDNTTTEQVTLQATLTSSADSITLEDYSLEFMN